MPGSRSGKQSASAPAFLCHWLGALPGPLKRLSARRCRLDQGLEAALAFGHGIVTPYRPGAQRGLRQLEIARSLGQGVGALMANVGLVEGRHGSVSNQDFGPGSRARQGEESANLRARRAPRPVCLPVACKAGDRSDRAARRAPGSGSCMAQAASVSAAARRRRTARAPRSRACRRRPVRPCQSTRRPRPRGRRRAVAHARGAAVRCCWWR